MIIAIFIFIFNIILLIYPGTVLAAAREGLLLWFNNVLPSLLPFVIAVNMLIALGFAKFLGVLLAPIMNHIFNLPGTGGFALVTGFTSGYPMGAKTIADLQKSGQLSTSESQHLLAFCNNAGPLFVIGVVGVGLFNSSQIGYILWATHVVSALILGLLLRKKTLTPKKGTSLTDAWNTFKNTQNTQIGSVLGDAVKNAMESMVFIGGLIILFNVIVAIFESLLHLNPSVYSGVLAGMAEVTGGVRRLSLFETNVATLGAAAFVIGFGGFSIHAQTFHFVRGTGVRVVPYLVAKVLHGVIAAGVTVIFWGLYLGG